MDKNFENLKLLVNNGGNCVNLGRTIKSKHFNLYNWVLEKTSFLDSSPKLKFNERVFCILNNFTEKPLDEFGKPARFVNLFIGYSLKKISHNRQLLREKKLRAKEEQTQQKQPKLKLTELEKFVIRNQKRNSHLYYNDRVEGVDYVVCPVSKERMSMVKSTYITQVLGMSVAEYDTLYPGARRVCEARKNNIRQGLHKVDSKSGKSKYQISQEKARKILSAVDETGASGYKRKGQKTRATHMSNVDEFGRNGYRRQADSRLTTVLPNGLTIEQNAHLKQKQTLLDRNKTGTGGASMLSIRVLKPIINYLKQNQIKYYFDDSEYGIKDPESGNYYFWDLTIPEFKIAIEYQSSAWHADPTLTEDKWHTWQPPLGKKKTADEVLQYDYNKARSLYKNRNFVTYYVWQNSQENDVEEILCLMKTLNTKF